MKNHAKSEKIIDPNAHAYRLELHGNGLAPDVLLSAARWHEEHGSVPLRDGRPARVLNSIGMELALVPAGTFLMGSPPDEPGRDPEQETEGQLPPPV